ncbi:ATP-binding cassette domain-containing protein [Bacillus mangrovi]|uniref:ATP-binding cassette domain-containing protein n=1 Tax=Metabacillus mangrovi TaxID=1491830 RepID=A0A7X2S6F8_9BACI|nr:ABC transporter ATP-binding protein [Metabacillus mangrovi]MTH53631.1 ATP-binding cassette domain-containing protein [Metabacillus mangrovi]
MTRVFSFLKPYRLPAGLALLLMLAELAVELLQPLIIARIIDEGILQKDLGTVWLWGGVLLAMSVLAFASGITNSFLASRVSQGFAYDIRSSLFKKVQSFAFSNLDEFQPSSLITRVTNDVNTIQMTVFMSLRIMIRAPLLVIGGTVMALFVNARLAMILVIAIPILIFFLLWVMKTGGAMFRAVQERLDRVNGVMKENLSGMRIIKAFLNSGYEIKRFTGAAEDLRKRTASVLRLIEMTMPVLYFVMNAGIIAILWFGASEAAAGGAKVGEVVAVVNYALRITAAISMFSFIIMAFSRTRASSQRVAEVLETESHLLEGQGTASHAADGRVEFRNVGFHYPEMDTPVLANISFTAEAGTSTAIMGSTGSGKSTLFQLIPRLYEPSKGKVLINGHEVETYRLKDLRSGIGYVPQESMLFTGTVKDNIMWGRPDASIDEVVQAAKDAQIHDTIASLPDGYDTLVGQKGVNLSGGQKQRLSIARALIRKPAILLLDDSTSALDLQTERKLLQAISTYSCTVIMITQKISTASVSDQILLLDEGEMAACGSHKELLDRSDMYRRIWQSQSEGVTMHEAL